jgi:hypothetical protein
MHAASMHGNLKDGRRAGDAARGTNVQASSNDKVDAQVRGENDVSCKSATSQLIDDCVVGMT